MLATTIRFGLDRRDSPGEAQSKPHGRTDTPENLERARDSRAVGDCEEGHFGYERTFVGHRFHWNGG